MSSTWHSDYLDTRSPWRRVGRACVTLLGAVIWASLIVLPFVVVQ